MATLGQYGKQLNDMSSQQVFDVGVEHLLTQGCRSEDGEGGCAYKGKNGLTCGAGIFITEYNEEMENQTWEGVVGAFKPTQQTLHRDLIESLQGAHDNVEPEDWKTYFTEIANRYGLKYVIS